MTTTSPQSVDLALYFDEVRTLAEMIEVLTELEAGYQECVQALNPPPGIQDSWPRMSIRTGSLFVEFTAAVESGAWAAAGLILFRALLTDTEPAVKLVLLPGEIVTRLVDQWGPMITRFRNWRLARRQFKVDEEARAACEAEDKDPAAGTLEVDLGTRAAPTPPSLPSATPPPAQTVLPPSNPTGAVEVAHQALLAGTERIDELQARTSGVQTDIKQLFEFLTAVLGEQRAAVEVVAPLQAVHPHLEEALGLLGVTRERLAGYGHTI